MSSASLVRAPTFLKLKKGNKMTIKEMRKAAGMTQNQLADYLGAHRRTVQGWESKYPCPEYIRALIEYKLIHEGIIKERS